MKPRLLHVEPPEIVIQDRPEPCPYLEGHVARLPVRMPVRRLSREETDLRLAQGDRRWGRFFYRPTCPECRECEAIRLDVREFRMRRNHRRTLARGDRELDTQVAEPLADDERIELFERHKVERDLDVTGTPMALDDLYAFLVDRCVEAFELRILRRGRLVGITVFDRGSDALSAVYSYFDPGLPTLGLGTYAILKQLELCREWSLRYLYLGYYIADNPHMNYKGRFLPHERLVDGSWRRFPER
jgi:arginine-tRNA-protein transferase